MYRIRRENLVWIVVIAKNKRHRSVRYQQLMNMLTYNYFFKMLHFEDLTNESTTQIA